MAAVSLMEVLAPACAPCRNFSGVCHSMRWAPEEGYIPCGFGGATGEVGEVRLIIISAEPSDPTSNERYSGSATEMVRQAVSLHEDMLHYKIVDRKSQYFPNLRRILNLFWPATSLDDQLRYTWFTNAVKCAAKVPGGTVPREIEDACTSLYLKRELDLFRGAYVLALGNKAKDRLNRVHIRIDGVAQHPSARPVTKPEASWETAAKSFRAWLGQ